jgi:DNA-binding transcriptional MerR regulator
MIQKEMAEDKVNSDKIYYRISEIADMFGVNVSLLRYWEKEFPQIKPKTNSRGVRLYKQADIDIIALIFHLVKERGMTLDGARRKMRENREDVARNFEVVRRLKGIRQQLVILGETLDHINGEITND